MKKNIIILFPTVAELLLYASGVPIQQNRRNSVASHSASPYIYPIDSSPTQRSDLDHVLNVLHLRSPVKDLVPNPESQTTSPDASTSLASHHARGSSITLPSIDSFLSSPPVSTPNFILPPTSQALPPQSPAPNSHQQHPPKSTSPSPPPENIPTQFGFVAYIPPVHVSKPAHTTPRDNHQLTSSAPVSIDPDRVPNSIPQGLYDRPAYIVADKLRRQRISSPDEVVEEMLVMKTLFENWLEHNQVVSINSVLEAWKKNAMNLANDERADEHESEGLEWWKKMIVIQMRAIAKLYEGQRLQPQFDHYWIDDETSFTTRLSKERQSIRNLDVIHIMKNSLPTKDLRTLETTDHTSEALLQMADRQVTSSRPKDEHINGALVLRRKAIQMWMLKGMTKGEFVEQKRILREIVAKLDERDFNKVRAEMVIISLQRFIEAEKIKWKEA